MNEANKNEAGGRKKEVGSLESGVGSESDSGFTHENALEEISKSEIPKSELPNMEVHHHLAENFREHIVERKRGKKYMILNSEDIAMVQGVQS